MLLEHCTVSAQTRERSSVYYKSESKFQLLGSYTDEAYTSGFCPLEKKHMWMLKRFCTLWQLPQCTQAYLALLFHNGTVQMIPGLLALLMAPIFPVCIHRFKTNKQKTYTVNDKNPNEFPRVRISSLEWRHQNDCFF